MQLRVEKWNGFPIRFVGSDDDWKAIGFDVAKALGYKRPNDALKLHVENKDKRLINLGSLLNQAETSKTGSTVKQRRTSKGGSPVMLVISEFGIYDLVFSSKMKQAKDFKRWVYQVIQQLRKQAGLQGYEAFRMLDKRIQKQAMQRLDANNEVDYIKANTITNKAVANKYGLSKMISKEQMTQEMKRDRPTILNDVVDLMNVKRRFGLDISVSKTIYNNLEKHK
ncbi:BRO-N domain-containing protein [Limosilactobacillus reuteri]|uniref:BRO-N domain-containing protein n=1 Tax=Limosilactobacillus reuteri TaxID=1598 RepID=UPI00214C6AEE|nr:Bro-N domain-containing protein [Limosilactobacillus reuteri]MCR1862559.1 Bro-N domain-containing protein [Limosilactobacillus reuteri]